MSEIFCPGPFTIFWYQCNFRWNSVTSDQFCTLWDGIWHARGSTDLFVHTLVFLYNRKTLAWVWWWFFEAAQRVVVKSLCFIGEHGASQHNWATCEIRFGQHQWDFVFISCLFLRLHKPNEVYFSSSCLTPVIVNVTNTTIDFCICCTKLLRWAFCGCIFS